MRSEQIIKKIVSEFNDAYNNRNLEDLLSFLANNVSITSPLIKKLFKKEIVANDKVFAAKFFKMAFRIFKSYKTEIINIKSEGKRVEILIKVNNIQSKVIRCDIRLNEFGKASEMNFTLHKLALVEMD